LLTGRAFEQLNELRSREAWANWLLCAALNFDWEEDRLSFTSDPTGSDGMIYDSKNERSWQTEHIMVPRPRTAQDAERAETIEAQILKAVAKKQAKGAAYASGKELVVFLDSGGGAWFPNRAAKGLPATLDFNSVWVIGLHGEVKSEYVYGATQLDVTDGNAPTWVVRINSGFDRWKVERIQ
jgi:hypothetical protein